MECLAILNRLSIFSCESGERADLCTALERESETLVAADVPLSALETAVALVSEHSSDPAIVRCVCTFLSSCALGDSQVVRRFLLQMATPPAEKQANVPYLVAVINNCLLACVVNFQDNAMGSWRSSVRPIMDLIATLSYNNAAFRSAFGTHTIGLIGRAMGRARAEGDATPASKGPQSERTLGNLFYYTISCLAVLFMADSANSSVGLSLGVVSEILYCYKCLNITAAACSQKRKVLCGAFGPVVRFGTISGEEKEELNKWCLQALRNAAIAAPLHAAWGSSGPHVDSPATTLVDFGRMGDIIAVDELKWELSKLRRTHSR